jgi:hypothetical protein
MKNSKSNQKEAKIRMQKRTKAYFNQWKAKHYNTELTHLKEN